MTQYTLEVVIDGQTHAMMIDRIPTTLKLRLLEHADPVVTVVAERVIL